MGVVAEGGEDFAGVLFGFFGCVCWRGGGVGLVWWEGEGKGKGWRRGEVRTGVGEVGSVAAGGVGDVFGGGTFHCVGAGVGRCSGVSWFGFQCLRDGLGGKVLMVGGWLWRDCGWTCTVGRITPLFAFALSHQLLCIH